MGSDALGAQVPGKSLTLLLQPRRGAFASLSSFISGRHQARISTHILWVPWLLVRPRGRARTLELDTQGHTQPLWCQLCVRKSTPSTRHFANLGTKCHQHLLVTCARRSDQIPLSTQTPVRSLLCCVTLAAHSASLVSLHEATARSGEHYYSILVEGTFENARNIHG